MRKYLSVLLFAMGLLLIQSAQAQAGGVMVLDVEGPITPAVASYIERGVQEAESRGAKGLIIQLNTPGGGVSTTLTIMQTIRNANIPVIVYVAPIGAQAASAGSIITVAGHASGMAPDTIIGAASPISDDGSDIGETAYRKIVEDLTATMRTLTDNRPPAATELAEEMIVEARAVTAEEALAVGLIDVVATDLDDLLQQLDGREVAVDGGTMVLDLQNSQTETYSMNLAETILHVLTNPVIIGLLLSIGGLAIYFELANPGGWVAGLVGVIMIGLALYGLGQLPVNWLGIGLVVVAFGLFIAELFTATNGALSLAGALCLLGGLLILFNSPGTPNFIRISIPAALVITGGTAALFIFIMSKAISIQKSRPVTGSEMMVGKTGPVRKSFFKTNEEGHFQGEVLVNGELWQAQAEEALAFGDDVAVDEIDGFVLHVRKISE